MFDYRSRWQLKCASVVVLCSAMLAVSGCITVKKRPALVVGNATELGFQDVVVTSGDDVYEFSNVTAFKVSEPLLRVGPLADEVTVKWTADGAAERTQSVQLPDAVRDYSGHIQFEIGEEGKVKVFTAPVQDRGDSVLPWSMPANWEGSPTVPGMNM